MHLRLVTWYSLATSKQPPGAVLAGPARRGELVQILGVQLVVALAGLSQHPGQISADRRRVDHAPNNSTQLDVSVIQLIPPSALYGSTIDVETSPARCGSAVSAGELDEFQELDEFMGHSHPRWTSSWVLAAIPVLASWLGRCDDLRP